MREIISIQGGKCGNEIGLKFWERISDEHGVDPRGQYHEDCDLQLEKIEVFYKEYSGCDYMYHPRNICFDLKTSTMDHVWNSSYGHIFDPENFVFGGTEGTKGNWGKGHYTESAELIDWLLDAVRREAEESESPQGFMLSHSMEGGAGGGMGSLLIAHLKEEFPTKIITTVSVFPNSGDIGRGQLSPYEEHLYPYSSVLTLNELIQNADIVMCMENLNITNICINTQRINNPKYPELNHLIGVGMAGITSSLRFPTNCELNCSLYNMYQNMVPLPNIHFLSIGISPFTMRGSGQYRALSLPMLAAQMFDMGHRLSGGLCPQNLHSPHGGDPKYLATSACFRGRMLYEEVDFAMQSVCGENSHAFVNYMPDSVKTSICQIGPKGLKMSVTYIINSTAISHTFQREVENFRFLYRKKAFVKNLREEGLEEMDLEEALINVENLIDEIVHL